MNNPWSQIPTNGTRVLSCDLDIINAYNNRYLDKPNFVVQNHLFPEPFIGDPKSPVYILGLNPGYSDLDDHWHSQSDLSESLIKNLHHQSTSFPFYFFNPKFVDAPGSQWWLAKARWLLEEVGFETLSRSVFCVELFPYHSRNYKPIPKSISSTGLVPSSQYSAYLVNQAISANKTIVAMRALNQWFKLVPELRNYNKLYKLNSPQNVSLSPKNMIGYSSVVSELITI